jgi:hypothetical protein
VKQIRKPAALIKMALAYADAYLSAGNRRLRNFGGAARFCGHEAGNSQSGATVRIKLLLDVHIAPEVAAALKRRFPDLDVKTESSGHGACGQL